MNSSSAGNVASRTIKIPELRLDHRQIAALFPFHLVLDEAMLLCQIGPSMQTVLPELQPGMNFVSKFELQRPNSEPTFEAMETNRNSIFIIVEKSRRLRFRGQIVVLPGQRQLAFLCSPWLPDQGELLSTGLTFEDFPLHDSMPEFLQVVQAQRLGMEDLRRLTAKLREQREALKESNRKLTEQSSEARKLALIAARTDNAVVITDAKGCIEWVNEGFIHITGFTMEEVRGKKPGHILQGPETDGATVQMMKQRLQAGDGFRCELLNYHKNGGKYWVAIEVQPIRDDAGQIVNFMAIESDITAHKAEAQRKDLAHEVSVILAESTEQEAALRRILQRIMDTFGYQFGAVWHLDEALQALRTMMVLSSAGSDTTHMAKTSSGLLLRRGAGLPGKVWGWNKGVYLDDWVSMGEYLRLEAAQLDGLQSAIAFPIRVAGDVFGVMEFHSRERKQPDEELLRTLSVLGNHTGQFLERSAAESERLRLVSLLKSTFESTQDGILVSDLKGNFLSWNHRFLELWGMDIDMPRTGAGRKEMLHRIAHLLPNANEFVRRADWWYRHPDQSGQDLIPLTDGRVLERVTQPQQSPEGVIGRVWVYRDVTQRWLAEKALRESEERYRVISSTASDGIISVNRVNEILFANGAADRMFGHGPGGLLGKNLYELMGTGFTELDPRGLLRVVRGGLINASPKATEVKGRRSNGQEFPLEVTFGKAHIQGQRVLTGVLRDVTERREAEQKLQNAMKTLRIAIEEAESANRAKSDFLASISHELRTPLNSIAGLSDLMRGQQMSEDQQDMVNTIWASSELLLHLINDLLDISKIEFGEVDLMETEFDLIAVCEHAIEVVKPRAMRKGLMLALLTDSDMPPLFIGDGNRIRQILINLLGNGVKFTETGSVTISLVWKQRADNQGEIVIEVQDTGIGIHHDDMGKIFEKFYRVDSRDVKRVSGTGLGLSISRKLAQAMGGSLTVSSIPKNGSCFRLQLQLPLAGAIPQSEQCPGFALLIAPAGQKSMLRAACQSTGFALMHSPDIAGALDYLRAGKPCQAVIVEGSVGGWDSPAAEELLIALHGRAIPCVWIRPIQAAPGSRRLPSAREIEYPLTPSKLRRALKAKSRAHEPSHDDSSWQRSLAALSQAGASRILMVEDNPDSAAYAKRVLDLGKHDSVLAATMKAAIEEACGSVFDVIFMDVMLPDGNGFEAARLIRAFEKKHGRPPVPIIALTAHAMEDYRQQALEAGMDDYLTKPIRKEALTAAIAKWAPNRATQAAEPPAPALPTDIALIDDDIADLIPEYLANTNQNVAKAEELLGQSDFAAIRKIGHNFKGSGGGFGFPEISRLGRSLEAAALDNDENEVQNNLLALQSYLKDVRWQVKETS